MTLTAESFAGRVLAAFSRRSPGFHPPTPPVRQEPSSDQQHDHSRSTAEMAGRTVAAIPVTRRLTLRAHPSTHAIITAHRIRRTLAHAYNLARAHNPSLNITHALDTAAAYALSLADTLDIALGPAQDRASGFKEAQASLRQLSQDLDIANGLAHPPDRDVDRSLVRALEQAYSEARALGRAGIARDIGLALAHTLALSPEPDLDIPISRALIRALDRAHACARHLDIVTARSAAEDLDRTPGGPYGLEAVHTALGSVLTDGALNDVTNADLRQADLTRSDMTGLRWTPHGTLWPPQIDSALLIRQSVERPSGSGIYVVMPDPEMTAHEAASL